MKYYIDFYNKKQKMENYDLDQLFDESDISKLKYANLKINKLNSSGLKLVIVYFTLYYLNYQYILYLLFFA